MKELLDFKRENGSLEIPQKVYFKIIMRECERYRQLQGCYYSQRILERSNLHPERVIGINETGKRKKLIKELKNIKEDTIERIFLILALHFNSRDVFIAFRGLQSDKKETRTATMEFLEGLISRNYKSQLFPIIESMISDRDAGQSEPHDRIQLPTEIQCYHQLLQLEDRKTNKMVIEVIADSNNPELLPLLVRATTKKDLKVAAAASEAYMKIQNISRTA